MTASTLLSDQKLQRRISLQLSSAIGAAIRSLGPCGHAAVYAQGNNVKHTRNAIDIIRYFTGDSAEETLLRETFVSAQRDLQDGIARLAAMFDGALSAGYELIAAGINPLLHQRTVLAMLPELDKHFASVTTPYAGPESLLRSFDLPDSSLALIRAALIDAGADGHIEVSASDRPGIQQVTIKGFIADVKPLTQGPHVMMSQTYVLVINDILRDQSNLLAILEGFANSSKSLVIVARGLEGGSRKLLEVNRAAGVLNVAVYQPTQNGAGAREILADLAVATGATLVCEEQGYSLTELTPQMLGMATSCDLQRTRLIFANPLGDRAKVALRLKEIEVVIQKSRYLQLDRENAVRRYARLAGNWVEISVDEPANDPGLIDRISRVCSAIAMARASGVIAGCGVGLAEVAKRLNAHPTSCPAEHAARYMLTRALQAPQKALRDNGCRNELTEDISDPAALSRKLLQIAVSLALQFMTINAAVLRS